MVAAWLAAALAHAQVNTDSLAGQPAAAGPSLAANVGAGLSAGNVSSVWWKADANAQYVTLFDDEPPRDGIPPFLRDRVMLYGSASRTAYDGEVVDGRSLVHLRYTRMWIPRVGNEVFVQLQEDPFVDLQERTLAGAGFRFDIVHAKTAAVWGGTGAMYERESLSDGTVNRAVRSTSYLTVRWALVPDHLTLSSTGYLQPRFDAPSDLRVLDEARLEAKVNDALALGTDLFFRHDSAPPAGVEPTDVRIGSSVTVRWGPPKR